MIDFYDVDKDYIDYLKRFDPKVPNIAYKTHDKFVCGIVLSINGVQYYAPISHTTKQLRTNLIITNDGADIASIRFSFMFPAPLDVLKRKDLAEIDKIDSKYADLLRVELNYCNSNEDLIYRKARQVYRIGCNPNHPFHQFCCDYPLLEKESRNYFK